MTNWTCDDTRVHIDVLTKQPLSDMDDNDPRIAAQKHLAECEACKNQLSISSNFDKALRNYAPPGLNEQEAVQITAMALHRTKVRAKVRASALGPAAVACAAGIMLALLWSMIQPSSKEQPETIARETASVPHEQVPATIKSNAASPYSTGANHDALTQFVVDGAARLWVAPNTVLQIQRNAPGEARFFVESGYVVAEINRPRPPIDFIIATPFGQVEAKGTVFSVDVSPQNGARTAVLRGTIQVSNTTKGLRSSESSVEAGYTCSVELCNPVKHSDEQHDKMKQTISNTSFYASRVPSSSETSPNQQIEDRTKPNKSTVQPPSRPTEKESTNEERSGRNDQEKDSISPYDQADEFDETTTANSRLAAQVSRATELKRKGNFKAAADVYRNILDGHAHQLEAQVSRVSLGQLELVELSMPRLALEHFDEYLRRSPNGFLSEPARNGRIRALKRLGKTETLIQACTEYLNRHPSGAFASKAALVRAQTSRTAKGCQGTSPLFNKIIELWPTSAEAETAHKALMDCH